MRSTAHSLAWVWQARHDLSFYDAPYVYLALRLEVPLVALDRRLRNAAESFGVDVVLPA